MRIEELESLFEMCKAETDHDNGFSIKDTYYKGYLPWFTRYRSGDETLDKNLSGMKKHGLSEGEAFFILAYTGGSSKWLNWDARAGDYYSSKCKEKFAELLDNSLSKMPRYENSIIYRTEINIAGDEIKAILKWFQSKQSQTFVTPYFLSTSREIFDESKIVWEIKTLHSNSMARDIHNLTNNHTEFEVLFQRNAKFEIKDVDLKKKVVFLQEVDPSSHADFELTGVYHKNL